MEMKGNSPASTNHKSSNKMIASSAIASEPTALSSEVSSSPAKPHGKGVVSTVVAKKRRGHSTATSPISSKSSGKAIVSSANGGQVMFFRDVSVGPHQEELRFRLVHFWEARNPLSKLLIGEEMLLIDEQGTAIQGFIPVGRVQMFMPNLVAGSVYKLKNFFGSTSKKIFSVADHEVTVSFTWNSVLTVIEKSHAVFPEDRFRFHTHEEFDANCDLKGDLYDFVGHMRLINGQAITDRPTVDESTIAAKRHIIVHVQKHDGPVIKLNLWDNTAAEFCQKYKSYDNTSSVILVTTVYPKRFLGTLTLASMSSSRVFLDRDVQPTREYLDWLGSNTDLANKIDAEVVTKPEKVTIVELFSFIKQENAKIAWFECTATIDDVIHGSPWYYISCDGCNTKATKGPTSLTCDNIKCERSKVVGMPQYRTRISVYDQSEQAVFVLLGEAGRALTGVQASKIVARYYEDNEK